MKIFVGEMSKNEKNIKNLLGVFFTDMVGIKKFLFKKRIFFCKINICEKDPQVPKNGFRSEKYEFANIFYQIFLHGLNFY